VSGVQSSELSGSVAGSAVFLIHSEVSGGRSGLRVWYAFVGKPDAITAGMETSCDKEPAIDIRGGEPAHDYAGLRNRSPQPCVLVCVADDSHCEGSLAT
jgi:hypothetical protein